MTLNRITTLILVILTFTVSYLFDASNEMVNFCSATLLLGFELIEFIKHRTRLNSRFIIRIWSTEWMVGFGLTFLLIYSFSDDSMTIWNICALVEVVTFGGLYLIRNRMLSYRIEESGIRNLFNQKLLESSTITSIKFDDKALVIDTTTSRNELIIKSDILYSPTWSELTTELSKLNRNAVSKLST